MAFPRRWVQLGWLVAVVPAETVGQNHQFLASLLNCHVSRLNRTLRNQLNSFPMLNLYVGELHEGASLFVTVGTRLSKTRSSRDLLKYVNAFLCGWM